MPKTIPTNFLFPICEKLARNPIEIQYVTETLASFSLTPTFGGREEGREEENERSEIIF